MKPVQPTGPLSAKAAFIGEAPGEFEQAEGIPFHPKAPAGKELDRWLAVAGFRRDEVYIANVIPIRPPKNDVACFYSVNKQTGKLVKGPRWDEFCGYVQELKGKLERCQANVIVALGRTALFALYGTEESVELPSISKLRGSLLTMSGCGRKLIPTYHPSPRNQDPEQRFFAMQDMIRIKGDGEFPELRLPTRWLETLMDIDRVLEWLNDSYGNGCLIGLDIETLNDEISHVSLSQMRHGFETVVIPFWTPYRNVWSAQEEAVIWRELGKVVETISCLGHNIQFDAYYLWRKLGIRVNVAHDTMVGFHIAYPGLPKDLGTLTSLYTREPYYKDDGGNFKIQPENEAAFLRYSALDAAVLHDILPGVLRDLKAQGNLEVYYDTIKLVEPVLFMQGRGIRLDLERRARMGAYYRRLEEHILTYMEHLLGLPLNPNSHPQCVAYFHGEKVFLATFKGWPKDEEKAAHVRALCAKSPKHRPSTKDGKIKVDEKALDKLAEKGDPVARLIVKARECGKLRATFLEYEVVDGRSRSELSVCGAVSGRFSGRSFLWGEGTNAQNCPHEIKACWIAD